MDQHRFDDIARLLGASGSRRAGLRAALGGLLGLGVAASAADADAKRRNARHRADAEAGKKKRRKRCKPACSDVQRCVKGACTCRDGGTVCGAACCRIGQTCENGQCVTGPDPGPACIAGGEPCKNVGRACCDGRVCASGQGGDGDVACYVPKTGRCERSADCVYGMRCRSGRCEPPQPGDLGQPCDAAAQQLCTTPGAVCADYTGTAAPAGAHCSLPLQKTCTGDPDCTCYTCWYTQATINGQGRGGRASTNTKACCHVEGLGCAVDQDCCLGLECVNGTCGGTLCTPDDTAGCSADVPCCNPAATCVSGTCRACSPQTCPNGCCQDWQCVAHGSQTPGTCGASGAACAACPEPTNACKQATCNTGVCGEANRSDGTACPGGACVNGTCCTAGCVSSGTCVAHGSQTASSCGTAGAACAACPTPTNACKQATCNPGTGVCGESNRANGTACTGGTCLNGTCCTAGCVSSGTCKAYADQTASLCGTAGVACAACPTPTNPCKVASCASGACGQANAANYTTACTGGSCYNGSCTTCDVCASGCPYPTVADAVADEANKPAGSTITVAPGVYPVNASIMLNRSLTVRVCGAESGVTLEAPAASGNSLRAPVGGVSIFKLLSAADVSQGIELTVRGIAFRRAGAGSGAAARAGAAFAIGIEALSGGPTAKRTVTAPGCTFDDLDFGVLGNGHADVTLGDAAIRNSGQNAIRFDSPAGAEGKLTATSTVFSGAQKEVLFLSNADATLTDCVVEGGTAATAFGSGEVGGGILFSSNATVNQVTTSATLTLAGTTTVRNNVSNDGGSGQGGGGGIALIAAYNGAASLVMTGTSSVTGNTTNGHGSGVLYLIDQGTSGTYTSGTVSATGTATRVFGNTGPNAQCELEIVTGTTTFTPLATCTPP